MTRLSVNINKIATIRNARGGDLPSVVKAAKDIENFGAHGITVHPRPDERHITRKDVYDLSEVVRTEFNIEGYPSADFIALLEDVRPQQATLVPDGPDVITSNAGWNCRENKPFLTDIVHQIKALGIRVSIFLDPDPEQVEHAIETGTDRIELYTEAYARDYRTDRAQAIEPYIQTAELAHHGGLEINAGHDLSLENLRYFKECIPYLKEVSIGHALISDALYYGLNNTVQMYLQELSAH